MACFSFSSNRYLEKNKMEQIANKNNQMENKIFGTK